MELPDAILAIPAEDRKKRVGAGGTAFMQLDLRRFFVRALLPVRLSDGHEFHFGVWLETPEETAKELWYHWDRPGYLGIKFEATLANAVPPWGESLLGSRCAAGPRVRDQLPYVESSSDFKLQSVLSTPWSRVECEQLIDSVWGRATA